VLTVNAGHPEGNDDLEKVLSATMRAAFPHVARYPIEEENTLIVASSSEAPSAGALRSAAPGLPAELRPVALEAAARLGPSLRGGTVYTDDRAPVEWLIDASIVDYAASG
jgi:hypothetical protein